MATFYDEAEETIEQLEKRLAAKKAYLQFMKDNPLFVEFLRLKQEAGE